MQLELLELHIGEKEGKYMSKEQDIDDGYEENPWDDEDGSNLQIIPDFLPPPEMLKNAKVRFITDADSLLTQDLQRIEQIALARNLTPTNLIAGVLHDFVTGNLVRRGE